MSTFSHFFPSKEHLYLGYWKKHVLVNSIFAMVSKSKTTKSDLWEGGLNNYVYPTEAKQLSIVSDSNNDNNNGTGAQHIKITGLDKDYNRIYEYLNLQGTTPVTTVNSYIRLESAIVKVLGNGTVLGNITITHNGNILGFIPFPNGRTRLSHYTIPKDHTGFLMNIFSNQSGKQDVTLDLLARENAHAPFIKCKEIFNTGDQYIREELNGSMRFSEGSDIKLMYETSKKNIPIRGGYELIVINNAKIPPSFRIGNVTD